MPDAEQRSEHAATEESVGRQSSRWRLGLLIIALGAYILVLAKAFPIDMDELLPYHQIACSSPAQALNVYTAPCGSYPINLGPFEFQRAFEYIGAVPALAMAPLLATTHWAGWHLVAGVVALVLTAIGITVSTRLPRPFSLVVIGWVPIALATIHDTGPIRYSILALAWTPALVRLFCTAQRRWVRASALFTLILAWVASTESKPFFLYLIPGALVWTAAALSLDDRDFARHHLRRIVVALGAPAAASVLLTLVLTVDGEPYLSYLASFGSPNSMWMSAGVGGVFLFVWTMTAQRFVLQVPNVDALFPDLLQGPANALPLTSDRGAPLSVLLMAVVTIAVVLLVGWAFWRLFTRAGDVGRSQALWLTAATIAFFLGAVASRGGSVHHFVYAQMPIVVLVVLALRQKGWGYLRATALALGLSSLAVASMLAIPFKPEVSADIDAVMSTAISRTTPGSVVNCQSWGCYYQYALADRDGVPIVWAERPEQQAQLAASLPEGATIWHVCRECDQQEVESGFPDATISRVLDTASGWRLFQVTP